MSTFDPVGEAAYFASIWKLSNAQMKQLEEAFTRLHGSGGPARSSVSNVLLNPVAWASLEALREARMTVPHSFRAYTSKNPGDHDLDTPLYTAEQLLGLLPAHEAGLTSPSAETAPLADREKSATEYQFKILVPGSNAKGSLHEATAETTLTGVLWTLRGNLAGGVQALIASAAREPS